MASVKGIGYPQDCRQLGNNQIFFSVQQRSCCQFFIGHEQTAVKPNHIGHHLTFCMREADDLRCHNNIVRTRRRLCHINILSAVMKQYRDLKQQPFPSIQSVNRLHLVKNSQCQMFHHLRMAFIRMIALCNITRRFNDIVFKVMLRFYNPAAFRIIISKTISQICADDDYIFRTGLIHQPFIHHQRWKEK